MDVIWYRYDLCEIVDCWEKNEWLHLIHRIYKGGLIKGGIWLGPKAIVLFVKLFDF